MTRCLNCRHDPVPDIAELCPGCGMHCASLGRDLLPPGSSLKKERYLIESALGRGLFGATYRAVDDVSGQVVAIKEFFPVEHVVRHTENYSVQALERHEGAYWRGLERFQREGRTIAGINHRNVVQVTDLFEEKGTAYMVMELVRARTLAEEMDIVGGRLDEDQAVFIVGALVGALDVLHAQGIYHLDIAPEHILIDNQGWVMLGDFGGARRELKAARSRAYSLAYAPLEVMLDGRHCGPESDIFALGMVIHEMLTGRKAPQALERWLEGGGWGDAELPDRWRGLVRAAVALRQEDRPNDIKAWWFDSFPEFEAEEILHDAALLEQAGEWTELLDVLEQRARIEHDEGSLVALRYRIAKLWEERLDDKTRAMESYREALSLRRSHSPTLDALERLYADLERWHELLELYDTRLSLAEADEEWVELYCKAGNVFEAHLGDREGALESYKRALVLDPHHAEAFQEVNRLYREDGRWSALLETYEMLARAATDVEAAAEMQCAAALVYEEHLGDLESAEQQYRRALDMLPSSAKALQALERIYARRQDWPGLLLALQLELEHTEDEEEKSRLLLRVGDVYRKLDESGNARKSLEQAMLIDPASVEVAAQLAPIYLDEGLWSSASPLLELQLRSAEDDGERFKLHSALARCHQQMGDVDRALAEYGEAHALLPDDIGTLEELIAIHRDQSAWKEMIRYKMRKASLRQEPEEQFNLLNDIGDVWREHLGDTARAVKVYNAALKYKPDAVEVLFKLLKLHRGAKRWPQTLSVLKKLAKYDKERAIIHLQDIAAICWEEQGDTNRAVDYLDKAIAVDPERIDIFETIEEILNKSEDWPRLERSYRKLLHHLRDLSEVEGLKLSMWKRLGMLYRDRMDDPRNAIAAFRVATALRPNDSELVELLADMYARSGSHHEEAVIEHRKLLNEGMRSFQIRIASLRGLFGAYMNLDRYDEAWCVASALSFLQKATDEEEQFYQRYLDKVELRPPKIRLTPDQWKVLYHPGRDRSITDIMGLLAIHMRKYYALTRWDWGAHKRDKVDLSERMPFCQIYRACADTVGLAPAPDVFLLKKDGQSGILNGNINPPAFIVGLDMFQGRSDHELIFALGRHLTLAQPGHYLGSGFFPTGNLLVFYLSAMQLAEPTLTFARDNPEVAEWMPKMQKKVPRSGLTQLLKLASRKLKEGRNFGGDLITWRAAVDHTASRVGTLLCGDLHAAASAIKVDLVPVSDASLNDKIREMVLFWISDEHFELRRQLGLALGR